MNYEDKLDNILKLKFNKIYKDITIAASIKKNKASLIENKRRLAAQITEAIFKGTSIRLYDSTFKHIDFIAKNLKTHKEFLVIVKTKPSMLYHNATGYEIDLHNIYLRMQKKLRVFIIFVDNRLDSVYAQWLDKLIEPYRDLDDSWNNFPHFQTFSKNKKGIFFNLNSFNTLSVISKRDSFYLTNSSKRSTRNYPKDLKLDTDIVKDHLKSIVINNLEPLNPIDLSEPIENKIKNIK